MKTTSFGNIHQRLRQNIATHKRAEAQSTGSESGISPKSSDPEVKDMLPSGGNPSGRGVDDLTGGGAAAKEHLPGVNTSLPKEEKERKEVSPGTKLASGSESISAIQDRLATSIIKAAELLKVAGEITSAGTVETPTDAALGASTKSDISGSAPVVDGVTGVTQAEPSPGCAADSKNQGPAEKKIAAVVEAPKKEEPEAPKQAAASADPAVIDQIAERVAQFSSDYETGRKLAHVLVSTLNTPDLSNEKVAAQHTDAVFVSTVNAMLQTGLESGIITEKQANDLAAAAGLRTNPLMTAIDNVTEKLAAVAAATTHTNEQKVAFVEKLAEGEEAAIAAAGGQAPVDPQEIQAAIVQLLQELQQAVDSGQMSEEQALSILEQIGLAPAGGAAAPAEAAPAEAAPAAPAGGGEAPPEKEKEPDGDEPKKEDKEAALKELNDKRAALGAKIAKLVTSGPKTTKEAADIAALAKEAPIAVSPPAGPTLNPEPTSASPSGDSMLPKYLPTVTEAIQSAKPLNLEGVAPYVPPVAMDKAKVPSATAAVNLQPGAIPSASAANVAPAAAAPAVADKPSILPYVLGALGIGGLGGVMLANREDEEKKSKRAEVGDPAMAAEPPPGGDPAAAAAGAAGAESPEAIVSELMQMIQAGQVSPEEGVQIVGDLVQSGQISPEDGQQLVAMIQQAAGGAGAPAAEGAAPPPAT